jgi:hypothetical protein
LYSILFREVVKKPLRKPHTPFQRSRGSGSGGGAKAGRRNPPAMIE